MLCRLVIMLGTMVYAARAFFPAGKCPQALLRPAASAARFGSAASPLRMMSSVTRPANPNRETLTGERVGWKKRKVALVVGYVGTGYFGLQFNPKMAHLPTIEGEIEDALYRAGHITESNYRDLSKIGWSRSSRTDKGVHAARLVLNAKLLIDPDWITPSNHVPEVVERVNDQLPDNIRAFSCFRSVNSFVAKEVCNMREYEYLLPLELVHDDAKSLSGEQKQDLMEKLNKILRKFEGIHSFHNFTRLKLRDINNKRARAAEANTAEGTAATSAVQTATVVAAEDSEEDSEEEEDDEEDEQENDVSDNEAASKQSRSEWQQREGGSRQIFEDWEAEQHPIAGKQKVLCTLYTCAAKDWLQLDGRDFIKITLRGQSFLLNQIRMMIGAAVLYARGILPEEAVDAALGTPYRIRMPVVPAEGLVLVDAEFGRSRTPIQLRDPEGVEKEAGVMMTPADDAKATDFLTTKIIPEVLRRWTPELILESNEFHRRFAPTPQVVERWRKHVEAADEQAAVTRQAHLQRDQARIEAALVGLRAEGHPRPDKDIDMDIYRLILPPGFSTALAREFELRPSLFLADIQRALAVQLLQGELAPTADTEVLLEHVRKQGIRELAAVGYKYRSRKHSK